MRFPMPISSNRKSKIVDRKLKVPLRGHRIFDNQMRYLGHEGKGKVGQPSGRFARRHASGRAASRARSVRRRIGYVPFLVGLSTGERPGATAGSKPRLG